VMSLIGASRHFTATQNLVAIGVMAHRASRANQA